MPFGIGIWELVIILLISFLFLILFIIPIAKLLEKAGYNKFLAAIVIVPLGLPVILYILAFSKWPAERR